MGLTGANRGFRETARLAVLLAAATAGAIVGLALGLPAGSLVGALVAVALLQLWRTGLWSAAGRLPGRVGLALVGAVAGTRVDADFVAAIGPLLPLVVIVILPLVVVALALGWLLARRSHLSFATAVLAMSPGGAGEMSASASRRGGDGVSVMALHLLRVVLIVVFIPPLVELLA